MARGWLIAAPASGAGKTTVTLGLLRALRRAGVPIAPFKCGPDYIDPRFHEAAAGAVSRTLDAWAMPPERLYSIAGQGSGAVIVEAAMGLFDGAADGTGSAAALAKALDLDVILVVDCAKQAQSVAALVHGFRTFDPALRFAGVILNRVASDRHEAMLRGALADVEVLGAIRREPALALPERHLGLVQAEEHDDLDRFLEAAADAMERTVDLSRFRSSIRRASSSKATDPPGQKVAIARDAAFAFNYPHMLEGWQAAGADLAFFSPLADEAPAGDADAVFLPGGYPELHAGRLAANANFTGGLRAAAERQATVYGECGGYMVLGEGVTDAGGERHAMASLLRLETTFTERRLHLGYRNLDALSGPVLGHGAWKAHEFHYCSATREEGEPLFEARDALGAALGPVGLRSCTVMGSWMHLIDPA